MGIWHIRYVISHSAHTRLKLEGPALEMHLLWCRTSICSCNVSVEGSLMLDNPLSVSFLCNLNYISLYFIQYSMQVTSKWLIPFGASSIILNDPGVLGHSLTYKFLSGQPVFPDHLSVSYDCDDKGWYEILQKILKHHCLLWFFISYYCNLKIIYKCSYLERYHKKADLKKVFKLHRKIPLSEPLFH